ncbi:MAG TPA: hypothetical protein PK406_14975 [Verrucomicrobiota bacterium]|nr:hypothetical protein [Verrucomicrobiota bacterium]
MQSETLRPKLKACRRQSAHWHQRDGTPVETVPAKDGTPRPVTIADARERDLLPSVSEILTALNRPGLTAWRMQEAVHAALTWSRTVGDDPAALVPAVLNSLEEPPLKPADLTAALRGALGPAGPQEYSPQVAGIIAAFQAWAKQLPAVFWQSKPVFSNTLGYAAVPDLVVLTKRGGLTGVSVRAMPFHGQKNPQPRLTDDAAIGMAASLALVSKKHLAARTLVIDTAPPHRIFERNWSKRELRHGLRIFKAIFAVWRIIKGYDPRRKEGV